MLGTCYTLLIISFGVGLLLAILLGREKRERHRHALQTQGRRVLATVIDIRREREERGPPEFPVLNYCYYIEAEWTDPQTGLTYLLKSPRLASYPQEYPPGATIPVLLDRDAPPHYLMELQEEYYAP